MNTGVTEEKTWKDRAAILVKNYDEVRQGIAAIPGEIEAVQQRIEACKKQQESVNERVEKAREERQGLLAEGKKIDAITAKIKAVREEQEILQDEIIGLGNKAENLRKENFGLLAKKSTLAKEIVKEQLPSLVEDYNRKAEVLARALREICLLHMEYDQRFNELGGDHISASSGLERDLNIRRFFLPGAENRQDIFNLRQIGEEFIALRKKREGKEGYPVEDAIIEVVKQMRAL